MKRQYPGSAGSSYSTTPPVPPQFLGGLLAMLLCILVTACGEGESSHVPQPTPTLPRATKSYSLVGTVNGDSQQGQLGLVYEEVPEFNLLKYTITRFEMGNLRGSGQLEFLTIGNDLTMNVMLSAPGMGEANLTGSKSEVPIAGLFPVFNDFAISGSGYTIVFSTTPR